MKIQDIEKELNITRANVRFYEKEGLLTPPRKENGYRNYGEEEIVRLKKIIIFRKIGISVADIKSIFDGSLSLQTAIDSNTRRLQKEIEELNGAIEVCRQIKENNSEERDFPQDYFWNVINKSENDGEAFNDIFADYFSFTKFILEKSFGFNYDNIKEKSGIKGILIIGLIVSVLSAISEWIFDRQGIVSLLYGFVRPLVLSVVICLIFSPLYFLEKKHSKMAAKYLTLLTLITVLFLSAIVILAVYGLLNAVF